MTILIGAVLFGAAAAVALLGHRQFTNERQIRHRALEQVGLRERPVIVERRGDADRRRLVLIGVGALIGIAAAVVLGPIGLFLGATPIVIDGAVSKRAIRKRSAALSAELAPALQLLVDNLRVGRDLVSALSEVADNSAEPIASLFSTVVSEVRLGTRVDEAFAAMADLENDRHLGVVASAVGLNIEFGGNLVEILGSVIESLEEEDRLRRDIDSLTADGRLSSQVLLALPILTLIVVSFLSPGYASPLIEEPAGRLMCGVGVILGIAGWVWLRALSNPEVVA